MENARYSNETFWIVFKHYVETSFSFSSLKMKKNDAWDMLSTIFSPSPWLPPGNAHMHGVLNKIVCECIKKS